MAHEIKKINKIMDELLLYFCLSGSTNIDMNLKIKEEESVITFKVDKINDKIRETLITRVNDVERDEEFEEYGWELLGESDCHQEFRLVGTLIDSIKFSKCEEEDRVIITLIRRNMKW